MESSAHAYKAVLFDMGGVLFEFKDPIKVHKLIAKIRANPELMVKYTACELGQIPLEEVVDMMDYAFPGIAKIQNFDLAQPEDYLGSLNHDMIRAAKKIRRLGFKIGVITNNYFWRFGSNRTTAIPEIYEFDAVVESCVVGVRKPDPRIYEIMLEELNLKANECIFVDDFISNVHAANKLGMTGVHLADGDTCGTIKKLEELLDVVLA